LIPSPSSRRWRLWIGLVPALVLARDGAAQGSAPTTVPPAADLTIRAIEIDRENVFPEEDATSFIPRVTNALHRTTQAWVVRRELLFSVGEQYDSARVAETERNLRSRGVFRFVEIDTVRSDSGLVVKVRTGDGWSTKFSPTIGRSADRTVASISLTEENLLGTAILTSVALRKDVDRTSVISAVNAPRIIRGQLDVAAQVVAFTNAGDGRIFAGQVASPWRTLSTRSAWSLNARDERRRILRFFDGERIASDTNQRRLTTVTGAWGFAPRASATGYTRVGFWGQFRREDFTTELGADTAGFARSEFGTFGATVEWRRARFVVTRSFQGVDREEDVDVSTTIRFGLAVTPEALGYDEDGVVPSIGFRTGFAVPGGFGYIDGLAYRRLSSAPDSGAVHIGGTVVLQPRPRHAAVFFAGAGWLEGSRPGGEFDLGADIGPRGFRPHAFTGERAFFTSAEYRILVAENLLNVVGVGIAAFVDYGGAWYPGEERRTGWDAGIGLRTGTSRSIDLQANRFDLVRCFGANRAFCGSEGGFALVVAKGFPFSTSGRLFR